MAITVATGSPQDLLDKVKMQIKEGNIDTWTVDSAGDFTHDVPQWRHQAWIRPKAPSKSELVFNIIGKKNVKMSREVYAIYHGRFVEMLLAHVDGMFSTAVISAMPTGDDVI